jgi:hypothetical protein
MEFNTWLNTSGDAEGVIGLAKETVVLSIVKS